MSYNPNGPIVAGDPLADYHRRRADEILRIVSQLNLVIHDLDCLQVGDVDGDISPIKHRIMDAVNPAINELREVVAKEWRKHTESQDRAEPREDGHDLTRAYELTHSDQDTAQEMADDAIREQYGDRGEAFYDDIAAQSPGTLPEDLDPEDTDAAWDAMGFDTVHFASDDETAAEDRRAARELERDAANFDGREAMEDETE